MDAPRCGPPTDESHTRCSPESDEQRAVYQDVASRLRSICAHLTPEEFDALVGRICVTKLRWSAREKSEPGKVR